MMGSEVERVGHRYRSQCRPGAGAGSRSATEEMKPETMTRRVPRAYVTPECPGSPEARHHLVPPGGIEPPTHGLGAAMSSLSRSSLLRVEEQRPVDRVGEVTFEGTPSLARGLSFGTLACQERSCTGVPAGLGQRDDVKRAIQLAVATAVQPVPDDRATRGWDRSGAGVRGEGRRRGEPAHAPDLAQDLRGHKRAHPADREQVPRLRLIDDGRDLALEAVDLG